MRSLWILFAMIPALSAADAITDLIIKDNRDRSRAKTRVVVPERRQLAMRSMPIGSPIHEPITDQVSHDLAILS